MSTLLGHSTSSTTSSTVPQLLLQTKLYQPPPADNLISRTQVIGYLNQPLPRKLTLITASAGYGKTTLATQWLSQLAETIQPRTAPVAWLSLDEYDDDLPLFLRYLVAAIQTIYPNFGENILGMLQGAQLPSSQQWAGIIVNDLTHLAQPLVLTLDDYHVITTDAIHQLFNHLLERIPPTVHFVLLSRTEPPLTLARLRVRRQMQELHADDLAFSLNDTAQFMTQTLGRELQPETLQTLHAGSEGWIAGLQLTALSLPRQAVGSQPIDETVLLRHFRSNNPYYTDYLFEEVLALQSPAIQEFLLQTSILDRFCAPLCQAILGAEWLTQLQNDDHLPEQIASSQAPVAMLLSWLRRSNLFLIPLDGEGIWYRYHHLFQQMLDQALREQMTATQIVMLHRRASEWLAEKGFTESAIRHALAAKDAPLAARLIEQQRHHLLSRHEFHTLDRWLSWLPEDVIAQRPALLAAQGWRNYFFYRARSTYLSLAKQAEALLDVPHLALDEPSKRILAGEIAALKALSLPWHSHAEDIWRYIQSALQQIPQAYTFVYPYLILMKANALNEQGNVAEAHAYLEAVLSTMQRSSSATSMVAIIVCTIHFNNGHLHQSAQGLEQLLNTRGSSEHTPFIKSYLHAYLGSIYYEWNQLDAAADHLNTVIEISYGYSLGSIKRAIIMRAALYQAQGQAEAARKMLDQLYELDVAKENDGYFLNEVQSFQANLLLREGELAQALQRFRSVKPEPFYMLDMFTEAPLLTQAQLLIALGEDAGLVQAGEILQTLKATTGPIHHRSRRIKVLALEVLLYQATAQPQKALAVLEEAITLAKPDRFIRTFADLGPAMAILLEQLRLRGFEPAYIAQILAAFSACAPAHPITAVDQPSQSPQPPQSGALSGAQPVAQSAALIEPLTEREGEVLDLLAKRLSNKEIAHALDVSPFTVKNHLSTIFQKLGVNGRREAVTIAKDAGLLH